MPTFDMNTCSKGSRAALTAAILVALSTSVALGAESEKKTLPGLPEGIDWSFNLDATLGAFGFADSLYQNPKPEQPSGDLSDNWMEGSIKPALSGEYTTANATQFYGKASVVGTRTFDAPPAIVGGESSAFDIEDLYIGWRSGNSFMGGENVLDFTLGRAQYTLGHGMLLWDGAADGSSLGGYWTGARKAFEKAAIGRFKPGKNTLEAFYLDKDDLPEADSDSKLWGVNYEYAFNENNTIGVTYMNWSAMEDIAPQRDGLNVYNARLYTAPFSGLQGLSFELEYAKEDNDELLDSNAWNAQIAYEFSTAWHPKLSYRYAFFEGDDPNTSENEAFDGLLTGFKDWGMWWQGEIAGEYFVSNSNLISHQVRIHTQPSESISTGLIAYDFKLDNPASAGVTSDKVAYELDWYMDWSMNDNFTLSLVAAVADPKEAVEQNSGRTDTLKYAMVFLAYSY